MTNLIDESALLLQVDNGDFTSAEGSGLGADASVEALIEQADRLDRQYSCHPITGTSIVRVEPDRITIGDDNLQLMSGGWEALAKYC